jgi:hypothetical protein
MFSRQAFVIAFFLPSAHMGRAQETAHIRIAKETLFEIGESVTPRAIAQAHNGDLIVAGSLGGPAWATRIRPEGMIIWRNVLRSDAAVQSATRSSYVGAVQLPDDSTLLCGSISINHEGFSLVTHVSKTGDALDQQQFKPSDKAFDFSDIRHCIPYRRGAVAIGIVRGVGPERSKASYRIVIFDSQAHRIAEHVVSIPGILRDEVPDGQDLVFLVEGAGHDSNGNQIVTTGLVRFDYSGAAVMDRTLAGGGYFVHAKDSQSNISVLVEPTSGLELHTVGAKFEDLAVVSGPLDELIPSWVGGLPDGSIVSFGQSRVGINSYTGSITWRGPTLSAKQVVMFEPLFANFSVDAVIFAGRPGEFIAARGVHPRGTPGSEKNPTGLMLSVLQVH